MQDDTATEPRPFTRRGYNLVHTTPSGKVFTLHKVLADKDTISVVGLIDGKIATFTCQCSNQHGIQLAMQGHNSIERALRLLYLVKDNILQQINSYEN